jgi:pimeloyl-ACP methyl ester carboxylesterase
MTQTTPTGGSGPTVALVHGAFADSAGWNDVVSRLFAAGVPVRAVSNPLRGISYDAAYVGSALGQITGPVLAVGHSYGGAIITNAALRAGNVVGLVYVAAFAPDEGEALQEIEADSKDSVLNSALVQWQYPTGDDGQTEVEFAIDPEQFHDAFAADVSQEQARVMAATQRPISSLGFTERTGTPAWRSLPSWAIVPTADRAAGSDVVRRMAERAGATITEAEGSHVIMVSQPEAVTEVIQQALSTLSA